MSFCKTTKMLKSNKRFHPRLIVADHFDSIINKINIETEAILCDQSLGEEIIYELNKTRQEQINKVKEIVKINMPQQDFDLNDFGQKWSNLMDDPLLNFEDRIDKIKQELISIDCVLLEHSKIINGLNLWITTGFYNKKDLEFLK